MKLFPLIRLLLRRIISNSFFWRIRHYLQPNFMKSYVEKDYTGLINQLNSYLEISSILDFGCATGTLLQNIKNNNPNIIVYGIEINSKMLNSCLHGFNSRFPQDGSWEFSQSLKPNELNKFLLSNEIKSFDCAVFDRVLYCLSLKEVKLIFKEIVKYSSSILIDDFFSNELEIQKTGYTHRNWDEILNELNFLPNQQLVSDYHMVEGAESKRKIYSKR